MAQALYLREDMALITVSVDQVPDFPKPKSGSWASLEGGDVEAENVKTRPGGMTPQVDLGGPTSRGDLTVKCQLAPEMVRHVVDLENVAGNSNATISYTPLDSDHSQLGTTYHLKGKLKTVQKGTWDANASNPQFLGLVFSLDAQDTIT